MSDDALAWRIEALCQQAWPALEEERVGDWRLRYAGGFTRRANSANPITAKAPLDDAMIDGIAARYRARKQTPYFRIPSLLGPAADGRLAGRGYVIEVESLVLYGARADWTAPADDPEVMLYDRPMPHWLAAAAHLRAHAPEVTPQFARVVDQLKVPAVFAAMRHDGAVIATAFAALSDGLLCFEAVVTDRAQRGRGFARRMVNALLAWGARAGATGACLQVEADNAAALAVYRACGMAQEVYRYHYRCPPA